MNNPYEVLGVSPSSTDTEIKEAYRRLARQYHPDQFNDEQHKNQAQEKMKDINNAYDSIVRERQNGNTYQNNRSGFSDVRELIAKRRYVQAEELLDGIPHASRNAEWYFLKGQVLYQKGWLEEANRYFTQAANMDPNNPEYRQAVNRSNYQRAGGYASNGNPTGCSFSACDMCSTLICADCCCECMGGDCISCC